MLVETIAFALVGLVAGGAALLGLPGYFRASRALVLGTAAGAALGGGAVAHFCLDGRFPVVSVAFSALAAAVLTSLLARPDLAAGRAPAHRHRPHRGGVHRAARRHRPA
ncbi:hypothetical protein [Kitasatospora sp. SUK 42]|uniref:hypothetical protein n=1 Tax=Kitasatospora sp. SUK 42 TaxID=1588882 RepID=UPI0018CA9764|nr:hypothetical protein [Kitasatospora sp. SUK 42]MBV2152132.1 hypothetical protein [Kitasatospora sp. SUK 42]